MSWTPHATLAALLVAGGTAPFLYGRDTDPPPRPAPRIVSDPHANAPVLPRIDFDRLRRSAAASVRNRRPSIFSPVSEDRPRSAPLPVPPQPTAPFTLPLVPEPAMSQFRLIGVAEEHTHGRLVRTAILSDDRGEPRFLKEGETFDEYQRVSQVDADSIVLMDRRTNTVRRMSLP